MQKITTIVSQRLAVAEIWQKVSGSLGREKETEKKYRAVDPSHVSEIQQVRLRRDKRRSTAPSSEGPTALAAALSRLPMPQAFARQHWNRAQRPFYGDRTPDDERPAYRFCLRHVPAPRLALTPTRPAFASFWHHASPMSRRPAHDSRGAKERQRPRLSLGQNRSPQQPAFCPRLNRQKVPASFRRNSRQNRYFVVMDISKFRASINVSEE